MKRLALVLLACILLAGMTFYTYTKVEAGGLFAGGLFDVEPEIMSGNITLQEFEAIGELRHYVILTGLPASHINGVAGWDCDDYARELYRRALRDGREIGLAMLLSKVDGKWYCHLANFAIVGNRIYRVEAMYATVTNWPGGLRVYVD